MAAKARKGGKTKRSSGGLEAAKAKLWGDIRKEFETTAAGVRELARKYGIASHATIIRRINEENWIRDQASITANLASEGVLATLDEKEMGQGGLKGGSSDPSSASCNVAANAVKSEESGKFEPPRTSGSLALAEQSDTVKAAKKIAGAQQRQMEKEIAHADHMIKAHSKLLEMLQNAMENEDLGEVQQLMRRFMLIGGKNESFSSLMRAAVGGLEKGVAMRRRALGMDTKLPYGGAPGTTPIGAGDLPDEVRRALPNLSSETLMSLRRGAAEIQRQMVAQQSAAPVIEAVAETAE